MASLETLGDLYLTVGNLAEGRKAYERQQAVSDALVKADAQNGAWNNSLAASTLKLGDVLRDQGDSAGALASYERGLEIRRALALANPQDGVALSFEAAAYLQVGALHRLQGHEDKALDAYNQARAIAERLAAQEPANEEAQATLARSNRLIGQIEEGRSKLAEALASFGADLEIAKKLVDADPANSLRQFDLAQAYANVGFVRYRKFRNEAKKYTENGDPEALSSLTASTDIIRRLIAADPQNTTWQRGLATSLEKFGEAVYFADGNITQKDSDDAYAAYTEAIAIREQLVQSDPTNKLWVGDLVKTL